MVTIETTVEVDEQGNAAIRLPGHLKPGTHRAVVTVFDAPETEPTTPGTRSFMADFPRHDVQVNLPADYTFRREQIYDDSGRGA